jgi:hypothetical protein
MSGSPTAQPAKFNFGEAAFGTANTAITSIFAYKTAKETTRSLAGAPMGNTAIIVGGLVAVGVLVVIVIKK